MQEVLETWLQRPRFLGASGDPNGISQLVSIGRSAVPVPATLAARSLEQLTLNHSYLVLAGGFRDT